MKETKKITTAQAYNLYDWYKNTRQIESAKFDNMPIKAQWALKKNMDAIGEIANSYVDFRNELTEKFQSEYFNDEKSERDVIEKEDGAKEEVLKIKEEFLQEYQEKYGEIIAKLNEIENEENDIQVSLIDINIIIDESKENTLSMNDLDMLEFMICERG